MPLRITVRDQERSLWLPATGLERYAAEPEVREAIDESVHAQLSGFVFEALFQDSPVASERRAVAPAEPARSAIPEKGHCPLCDQQSMRSGKCVLCGYLLPASLLSELPEGAASAVALPPKPATVRRFARELRLAGLIAAALFATACLTIPPFAEATGFVLLRLSLVAISAAPVWIIPLAGLIMYRFRKG
jgi:hypothetical protein